MIEQYDRIKKHIEEKIKCSFDDITKKSDKINIIYKKKFSTYTIYGEYCFPEIANAAWIQEKDGYWTLAEKCIRRKQDIRTLKNYYQKNQEMLNEISDAEVFSILMVKAIPLELLYAMEYEEDDDYVFDDSEECVFNYLKILAQFYLQQTQKYEDLLEQEKNKHNEKTKTKK